MLDSLPDYAHRRPYILQGAEPEDVSDVVHGMRESDRFEFAAFGHVPEDAWHVSAVSKDIYTAYVGHRAVFIFGTVEVLPGVRQLFGFGTPQTRRAMPAVTWFTKTFWLPEMAEAGVRRIQVHVPRESTQSVQWLQSFGMRVECEMPDYAANDATMLQLAFTRKDFQTHVLLQETAEYVADGDSPG